MAPGSTPPWPGSMATVRLTNAGAGLARWPGGARGSSGPYRKPGPSLEERVAGGRDQVQNEPVSRIRPGLQQERVGDFHGFHDNDHQSGLTRLEKAVPQLSHQPDLPG